MQSTSASLASPRSNNFNFIRLLLASSVMLSHGIVLRTGSRTDELLVRVFHSLTFGELAVVGFFVLSGYLISQSWVRQPRLGDFLVKRALRIVPGFVVAFFASVFVVGYLSSGFNFFAQLNWPSLFRNLLTLDQPTTPKVFSLDPYPIVNGSMWTITYEVRCYLLVALVGICGLFAFPKRLFASLLGGIALLIVLGKLGVTKLPHELQLFFGFDFYRLVFAFFCGSFFFLLRDRIRFNTRGALIAAVLVCAILTTRQEKFAYLAVVLPFAYLLFWFAELQTPWLERTRTWPDFSYGIYLYGWPVQKIVLFFLPTVSMYALLVPELLLAVCCGALSWHIIEKPALKWKPKSALRQAAV